MPPVKFLCSICNEMGIPPRSYEEWKPCQKWELQHLCVDCWDVLWTDMFTLTEQDLVTKFKHNPVPIANAFYLINRKRRAKARRWQAKRTRQIMHDRKTTRPSKALPKPLCKKKITALGVNW